METINQYTKKWAKEQIKNHGYDFVIQVDNLGVYAINNDIPDVNNDIWCVSIKADIIFLESMLEYSRGWKHSLVKRKK